MAARIILLAVLAFMNFSAMGQERSDHFQYLDVFDLQYASDPRISPDGEWILYRRMGFDIMQDRSHGNLWMIRSDGSGHSKLTSREGNESSPIWSPEGERVAFVGQTEQGAEIYIYWLSSGKIARITQLPFSPSSLTWSNKGDQIAFVMHVPEKPPIAAQIPPKPKGAKWAEEPRMTDRLKHEADGRGYIPPGYTHIFTVPAEGGAIRQLSSGNYQHRGNLSWSADDTKLLFSANRKDDWEYDFRNSEIYSLEVNSGEIAQLTSKSGPDHSPLVSPNGKLVAYLGFEDKVQAHQNTLLRIMNLDGSEKKTVSTDFDRSISNLAWSADSKGLYFNYDDRGNTKIAYIDLSGRVSDIARDMGGTTIGRPYASGSFTVSKEGLIAYTLSRPEHPADLAVVSKKNLVKKITDLNKSLLGHRKLGRVEELRYRSSFDNRDLQGWVVYPPDYEEQKKYPLLVENHGGPILNYGDRFSAEMQLYAAQGYIVFYPNPRGSTGYGEEFANLLYNNYPGEDYNDVMDGVDALIQKGLAHEDQLYVTGGSAGGIMTAWIIGKNDRFEAAVVAKPVINWISKTLVADNYFQYADSRYPGQPWENFDTYWKFSPLSLVGNVKTPTMVMVGMNDLRTPPSEAKQYYHALKLRRIETLLMEIPDASHGIASKPSNLIRKVANTIAWFEKFRN